MAFPNTAILDDFNRANANPIGGNWTKDPNTNDLQILSNQLSNPVAGSTYGGAYWNPVTFAGDLEIYVTFATVGATGHETYFSFLKGFSGAARDGYSLQTTKAAGTDTVRIYRFDNAAATLLGATINQEFSAGDSLGLEWVGSTLTAYYKASAGSWVSLGSRTDATYAATGVSLETIIQNSTTRLDNFGGGAIAAGQPMQLRGTTVPRLRQWQPRGLRG